MKKHMTAAALALLLPTAAFAQSAPAPAPEKKCCCKEMHGKMDCCKAHGEHEGEDKSGTPESKSGGHDGHQPG